MSRLGTSCARELHPCPPGLKQLVTANMNRIEMPADMHVMLSCIMILDWFSADVVTGNNHNEIRDSDLQNRGYTGTKLDRSCQFAQLLPPPPQHIHP